MAYNSRGNAFLSGSEDGQMYLWRHELEWSPYKLETDSERCPSKFDVSTTCWTCDDRYALCSIGKNNASPGDCSIHVWDSKNLKRVHVLQFHHFNISILKAHPFDPRIVISGSRDGRLAVWDVVRGVVLSSHDNLGYLEGVQAPVDLLDGSFSPNGDKFVCGDLWGNAITFGFCENYPPESKAPPTQFFDTDFHALTRYPS